MNTEFNLPPALLITNVIAVIMLGCSWKYPRYARFIFSMLFLIAAITNLVTINNNPQTFLSYGDKALLPFYKSFIVGFFSKHIQSIVFGLVIFQVVIAMSLWLKGSIFKAGCAGAIIYLLLLTPLGVSVAFPFTLIAAAAIFLLLKQNENEFLWKRFLLPENNGREEASEIL